MDLDVINKQVDISNEEWVTYPNGRRVLLHTTKSLLRDKDSNMIGILGISRDMTEEFFLQTFTQRKSRETANVGQH